MPNGEQTLQKKILKPHKPTQLLPLDRVDNLVVPALPDKDRDNICLAVNIKQLEDVKPRSEETKYKLQ